MLGPNTPIPAGSPGAPQASAQSLGGCWDCPGSPSPPCRLLCHALTPQPQSHCRNSPPAALSVTSSRAEVSPTISLLFPRVIPTAGRCLGELTLVHNTISLFPQHFEILSVTSGGAGKGTANSLKVIQIGQGPLAGSSPSRRQKHNLENAAFPWCPQPGVVWCSSSGH